MSETNKEKIRRSKDNEMKVKIEEAAKQYHVDPEKFTDFVREQKKVKGDEIEAKDALHYVSDFYLYLLEQEKEQRANQPGVVETVDQTKPDENKREPELPPAAAPQKQESSHVNIFAIIGVIFFIVLFGAVFSECGSVFDTSSSNTYDEEDWGKYYDWGDDYYWDSHSHSVEKKPWK